MPTLKATPRSSGLGALADALAWAKKQGNRANLRSMFRAAPLNAAPLSAEELEGWGLGDLLLGKTPEEVNEWAHGNAPLQVVGGGTGSYMPQVKRGRDEGLTDALFTLPAVGPLAKQAARGTQAVGRAVAEHALQPTPRALSQLGAVRLKGGNFSDQSLDQYLGDLRAQGTGDTIPAVQAWKNKQLRNYIRKEMGSPSDPLLQVEKEGRLHLPEDVQQWGADANARAYNNRRLFGGQAIPEDVPLPGPEWLRAAPDNGPADVAGGLGEGLQKQLDAIAEHEHLSGGASRTPWGFLSDNQLQARNPQEEMAYQAGWIPEERYDQAEEILAGIPEWLKTAPPDTKIWGFPEFTNPEELGFQHVMDYLSDAVQAGTFRDELTPAHPNFNMHPFAPARADNLRGLLARDLALTPEQLSRLSVADAVRKTHDWNKTLGGAAELAELQRGIRGVHKEYPDGSRWVELGTPGDLEPLTELPKDYIVRPHPKLKGEDGQPLFGVQDNTGQMVGAVRRDPEEAKATALQQLNEQRAKEELAAGLNAEGKAMGHCVGSYCEDVRSRGTKIYSLRDKAGRPHVTVEVRPGKITKSYLESIPDPDAPPADLLAPQGNLHDRVNSERSGNGDYEQYAHKLLKKLGMSPPPDEIVQIKGKQNAAPVEAYLPYVQDFVKGGQWGRVGDLRNAGLRETRDVFNDNERTFLARKGRELGAYLQPNEIDELQKLFNDGAVIDNGPLRGRPLEYASGGLVDNDDPTARLARALDDLFN